MHGKASSITLNNGVRMPVLGLGALDRRTPELIAGAVETAIANGYRLIDTAASYATERQVGAGIARSGIERSEIFVTTKLWISDYGYEQALRAYDASLRRLGLEYVDLYLLHWPVPSDFDSSAASWRAMEKLLAEGKVRAIGVSNHTPRHLDALMARGTVVPAVNQVELHPFFIQREVRAANARHGIATQSWAPLGVSVRRGMEGARTALAHPVILDLAARYGKTAAQIVLRWHVQNGFAAIPKSVRAERIAENIDIFGFMLSDDEMAAIDAMDTGVRGGPDPEVVDTRLFTWTVKD